MDLFLRSLLLARGTGHGGLRPAKFRTISGSLPTSLATMRSVDPVEGSFEPGRGRKSTRDALYVASGDPALQTRYSTRIRTRRASYT